MFLVILKQAVQAIFANKVRSILTTLGIVIGISSVSIMLTSGDAVKQLILDQLQSAGTNIIRVAPGQPAENGPPVDTPDTLKIDDFEDMERQLVGVEYLFPQFFEQKQISYREEGGFFSVSATTPDFFTSLAPEFSAGRPFTEAEVDSAAKVAVLGVKVREALFDDDENPVGQRIKMGNTSLQVIGVTKEVGGIFGLILDVSVGIPISTGRQVFGNRDWLNAVLIEAETKEDVPAIKAQVTDLLRRNHRLGIDDEDDFAITTQESSLQMIDAIFSIITLFVSAVASISLFVGGIGIMNIMYVTVTERTREIGLRKAIGAKKSAILLQFLLEAILLTMLGAAIGLGITYAVVGIVNLIFNLAIGVSMLAIIISVGISSIFGVGFGFFPARQAANKNPIDALRYE